MLVDIELDRRWSQGKHVKDKCLISVVLLRSPLGSPGVSPDTGWPVFFPHSESCEIKFLSSALAPGLLYTHPAHQVP